MADVTLPSPATHRLPRRGRLALVTVGVVLLVGLIAIWVQGPEQHGDGQGPLGSCGTPCGWADKVAQVPGVTSWTFGVALCLEPGAGVAVLDSVGPITTVGKGFTLVGTGVRQFRETPSHTFIIGVDGWPPPADQVSDVVSSVVRYAVSTPTCSPTGSPTTEPYTELLIGLGVVNSDGGGWQGLAIGYTAGGRHRVLDLDIGLMICGASVDCGGPSPTTPPATAPSLTPVGSFALDCGPLATDSCTKAVAAAMSVLQAHPPVLAVRIDVPTALMTCPPGGGGPAPGAVKCELVVDLTTSAGHTLVPLIRSTDGWIPTYLVR